MNSKATTCPPTDTLNDFVEGKLEPPTLDECELHIAECPACLETLRGLGTEDTLTGHVAAAMNEPDATRSSVQLDNLLERMLQQPQDLEKTNHPPVSHVPAELMADRAAEVLRCLEPTDDASLGAIGDYDLERLIGTGSSGCCFSSDRSHAAPDRCAQSAPPFPGRDGSAAVHQRGPIGGVDRTSACGHDLSGWPSGSFGIHGDAMDPGSIVGAAFVVRKDF